jgi:hypothetical protein
MPLAAYADTPRAIRLFPSRSLARLVLRHARACEAQGLHLHEVDGEQDDVVHRWLLARGAMLPVELADDLERIEDLADDRGATALQEAARRHGTHVHSLGLDPLEVAVRAFLDHRALFDSAHGRRLVETLRGTTEFVGREALAARDPEGALRALELDLGRHFDARARSAHCRITLARDEDRLVFTVAHGALVRADEALEDRPMLVCEAPAPVYLAERPLRYRPQRRDVVVYEAGAGRLRIRAGDAPTLHAYRRAFGELLFGQAEWFGNEPIVSLEPLVRLGAAVEAPTRGLREVKLVGLILRHAAPVGTMALDAEEIWPYLDARLRGGLEEAQLVEATFRVFPQGSASAANVKVRAPNRVEYGRIADDLFRPFLEERGFLARAGGRAGV